MVARAVIVGVVVAGGVALWSCSYSKADDSPVPARTSAAIAPPSRVSVVGTLPPITNAPTTTAVPLATSTTAAPVATTASPPRATTPKPTATAAPATHTGGPVTVQAGAFATREAAAQALAVLAGKGFGGFGVSGDGPFRVVRGGLSGADGDALVRSLAAAGISAFVRG